MAAQLHEVPLFPLGTVLFPGGWLPLKIFEQRYMDMAKLCLKNNSPFGVCLIASGRETGVPALPHNVGTLARITEWDMPQLGVLQVKCHGEQRFRLISRRVEASGLQRGEVELIEPCGPSALEPRHEFLADLLMRIVDNIDDTAPLQPFSYSDPLWVSHRLAELLPMNMALKQEILELDDPVARLDVALKFLQQSGLLNTSR